MTTVMPSSSSDILRPIPRRAFELANTGPSPSTPSTPRQDSTSTPPETIDSRPEAAAEDTPPSRTRSLLNLTSSTLFGIYSPTTATVPSERETEPVTPLIPPPLRMGDSSENTNDAFLGLLPSSEPKRPSSSGHHHHHHHQPHISPVQRIASWMLRTGLLFAFGVAYGMMILHLHDHHQLAPVEVIGVHSFRWSYALFWGGAGVVLGRALPWVDTLWEEHTSTSHSGYRSHSTSMSKAGLGLDEQQEVKTVSGNAVQDENDDDDGVVVSNETGMQTAGNGMADWSLVVRSIGAFVGIAFAIVRYICILIPPPEFCPSISCQILLFSQSHSQCPSLSPRTVRLSSPIPLFPLSRLRPPLFRRQMSKSIPGIKYHANSNF